MNRPFAAITILLLALWFSAGVLFAADITVADDCSLAEAISAANSDSRTGNCPAGAVADTIFLTSDVELSEEMSAIASIITIEGGGYTVDGDGKRIFRVSPEGDLTIKNLTLTGGHSDEDSVACVDAVDEDEPDEMSDDESVDSAESAPEAFGGAICIDQGKLNISNSLIRDNSALDYGGAIENWGGSLVVAMSEFSGNTAGKHGGAIYNNGGSVDLSDTVFNNNQAVEYGGAIDSINGGVLTVNGGVFNSNQAATGGAIGNWQASISVMSSNFHSNKADNGGTVQSEDGSSEICDSEFSSNVALNFGGAIYSIRGTLIVDNNVFRLNSAGEGGIIHIIEPDTSTISLSANSFIENEGEDCVGCGDTDLATVDCSVDRD